jgi:monoterpene epsilon-lactone hydrolase
MSSWQMKGLGLFVALAYKRRMSTRARALKVIAAPKGIAVPPRSLLQRHLVREEKVGDFTVHVVEPRSGRGPSATRAAGVKTVVYLHGGAYISEIVPAHWAFVSDLVDAGCRVVVPGYGLAPDHHVDEAVTFVTAVYEKLLETVPAATIAFAGDSAGAGLALGVVQSVVGNLPVPSGLVLISPWLDVTMENPEITALESRDPWLSRVGLVEAGKAWLGGAHGRDPRASPIYGTLAGLPPMEVVVGTRDLFLPDTELLARRCSEAGVPCVLEVVEGAVHVYPLTPTPEGRATARRLVASLAAH